MLSIIFNKDNFIVFSFVFFIQILGLNFLLLFFKNFFKKNNLFLNLSYSWVIGNSVLNILLFLLFFADIFAYINLNNFIIIFIFNFLFLIFLLFKRRILKIKKENFFYLLLIIIFFMPLIINSLTSYLLSWDALGIWFLKGKVIYYGKDHFFSFLKSDSFLYSNQSYPIGIPLILGSLYKILNHVNDQASQIIFLNFYLSLIFLFFGLMIYFFSNKIKKLILLLIILIIFLPSNFIIYSHNGYIDLPLGFGFATALAFLFFYLEEKNIEYKSKFLTLIFLNINLILNLKNEALPYAIFVFIAIFFSCLKSTKYFLVNLIRNLIFITPFLIWNYYVKINRIPFFLEGNYIIRQDFFPRFKTIINFFLLEIFNTSKYGLGLIFSFIILIFFGSIFIFKKRFNKTIIYLSVIIFFQILSYVYVYLITPLPFFTYLNNSIERIFLQFIPLIYFLAIVFVSEGIKD